MAVEKHKKTLAKVKGFYDDVTIEEEEINNDLINNILLKSKKMQEIDLAMKSIMMSEDEDEDANYKDSPS